MSDKAIPIGPNSIGQIHISVRDIERAVAWYRDVLGLEFLFDVPGQSMAFFKCGDVRLYLGKPEDESFRSQPILYYRVPQIETAVAAITERGGEFFDRPHMVYSDENHELWLTGLRDPDGIAVILMEERPFETK